MSDLIKKPAWLVDGVVCKVKPNTESYKKVEDYLCENLSESPYLYVLHEDEGDKDCYGRIYFTYCDARSEVTDKSVDTFYINWCDLEQHVPRKVKERERRAITNQVRKLEAELNALIEEAVECGVNVSSKRIELSMSYQPPQPPPKKY